MPLLLCQPRYDSCTLTGLKLRLVKEKAADTYHNSGNTTGASTAAVSTSNPATHMERNGGISKLRAHEANLRRLSVERLYFFGSTARGEAREDSDVDLCFDHRKGELGLYQLTAVKDLARRILGRSIDIITRTSLRPILRKRIEAIALRVF
jgi:uncharacterized protein